jgi:dCMP deaminase
MIDFAKFVALKSFDPSTKVGAVIMNGRFLVGTGHNTFPRGVDETEERLAHRPTKYAMMLHAEANAILSAGRLTKGATLYCTLQPCSECAKLIIQAGIRKVVCIRPTPEQLERWGESFEFAQLMFKEAGVEVLYE